jgi:hypothetical protein
MSSVYHDGWLRRYIGSILIGKSLKKATEAFGGDGGSEGRFIERYSYDGRALSTGVGNSIMNRTKEMGNRAAISA